MAFESGSLSFRMFYVTRPLPADAVARFAEMAAPSLEALTDGEIHGWVSGEHLLARVITEQNAFYGGHLRLALMKAQRKIPAEQFRAEVAMEVKALKEATGKAFLTRGERKDIKDAVTARLLPKMPPTIKGIPFVYDDRSNILYAAAMSEKQADALSIYWAQTLGFNLVPVIPEVAALNRLRVNIKEWGPVSFSREAIDDEVGQDAGDDFLTWLWFFSEARGGIVTVDYAQYAVMIEGPLHFVGGGCGAQDVVLRKGEPRLSAEAKAALVDGKKLHRAKVTLAQGSDAYCFTFEASNFAVRGLKLPDPGKMDAVSLFQDRINAVGRFADALLGIYDQYVKERNAVGMWSMTVDEMQAWVAERKVRQ